LNGILVVDKPKGPTSARVVAQVKRALGAPKVGHTGTLDPMATGVLPLCIGGATRIAQFLLADDKAYEGELVLGIETDTLDAEGEITARDPEGAAAIDEAALRRALEVRLGESMQRPPMFSALRKDGVRLHELARRGEQVERPARPIRIDAVELLSFDPPRARFAVACSKGTYVRSLVDDIGRDLGCGAHLGALRRTRSGRFTLADAVALDDLTPELGAARLVDLAVALDHLPAVPIPTSRVGQVADGLRLSWKQISNDDEPLGTFRLLDGDGRLRALAHLDGGVLTYDRVLQVDA
jgi:tRNA pseudouridine55 synthase